MGGNAQMGWADPAISLLSLSGAAWDNPTLCSRACMERVASARSCPAMLLPIRSCEETAIPLTLCPGHRLDAHPGRSSLPLTLAGAVFQPHPLVVAALPAAVPH